MVKLIPGVAINAYKKDTHGARIKIGILTSRPLMVFPQPFAVILETEVPALATRIPMLHTHVLMLSLPSNKLSQPAPPNRAFAEQQKLSSYR